jgi:hypothetical protein
MTTRHGVAGQFVSRAYVVLPRKSKQLGSLLVGDKSSIVLEYLEYLDDLTVKNA